MPVQVKIDFDVTGTLNRLKWFERSSFPFLYAKSLTLTAEDARVAVGDQSRQVFKLHSEFIPRNIKKEPALKADFVRFGFAEAAVFTGRKLDGWMGLHEEGGEKVPYRTKKSDRGKALALPGQHLKRKKYKTKTGKVRKRWTPGRLLEDYNQGRLKKFVSVSRGGHKKSAFIIKGRNSGVPMLVRRMGKARFPLEILYVFAKKAHIKKSWGFEKAVRAVVNSRFKTHFEREFQKEFRKV